MPLAVVECIDPSAGRIEQQRTQHAADASLPNHKQGVVNLRFGQLFLDGKKLCSLTNELLGPPDRDDDGVQLRLVGGRCIRVNFLDRAEATDAFYSDCHKSWKKEAAKAGRAASVAMKLEKMSQAAREGDGCRSRSRSHSTSRTGPSRKRLLRRLSSVESEGVYRVQHAEDLRQERKQLEESQEQHIVLEHIRRKVMTRTEFIESLRKEAALQAKITELKKAEQEEQNRFDALRSEEALLHVSLQDTESDDNKQSDGVSLGSTAIGGSHFASDGVCAGVGGTSFSEGLQQQAPGSNSDRRDECVICFNSLRSTVFLPCKHLVCCERCGQDPLMQKCPMCRAKIDWRFKAFL